MKSEYKILYAETPDSLENLVNEYHVGSIFFHGGVAVACDANNKILFCQAIVVSEHSRRVGDPPVEAESFSIGEHTTHDDIQAALAGVRAMA